MLGYTVISVVFFFQRVYIERNISNSNFRPVNLYIYKYIYNLYCYLPIYHSFLSSYSFLYNFFLINNIFTLNKGLLNNIMYDFKKNLSFPRINTFFFNLILRLMIVYSYMLSIPLKDLLVLSFSVYVERMCVYILSIFFR